jgi:predicted RecB family nuclease
VAATAKALADGAPVVYEASFLEDGIFVSVDILQRRRQGFVLIEVKSTLDVKAEHLPDVAVQLHVLRRAGLEVKRAEVMHLNRECRHPDLSNLFIRESVTQLVRSALRAVPKQAGSLLSTLTGPLAEVAVGEHCRRPYVCPFLDRCWPPLPEHHVSTLYGIRNSRVEQLVADGMETLYDLPLRFAASGPARRQIRSVKTGKVIVKRGLRRALAALRPPIAFLDFETVNPAVPAWPGCHPYEQVPVQFSCHVLKPRGMEHHAWLAEGRRDPRKEFSRALLRACADGKTVLAYNAPFERRCVDALAEALPHLRADLAALSARIRDLLPIVRDHVYHPDFGGSFSIKDVLPALVADLGYEDLEIRDGNSASTALEDLLLRGFDRSAEEKAALRRKLLSYCERDTLAMIRVHRRLIELSRRSREPTRQ